MLAVDRTVQAEVSATPEQCLARLADVAQYPTWSSLITSADIRDPRPDGSTARASLRAEVLKLGVEMDCALDVSDDRAVLRRLPYDAEDQERFTTAWTVTPSAQGSLIALHVEAALDAPGPANLLRRRIERALVDDLLADFVRAL